MDTNSHQKDQPESKGKIQNLLSWYHKNGKILVWIPIILFIFAIAQISFQTVSTGSMVNKGISLQGGTAITIQDGSLDARTIESALRDQFPSNDVNVRTVENFGSHIGITIETDIEEGNEAEFSAFMSGIEQASGKQYSQDEFSIEFFGGSLGQSFFAEIVRSLIIAFIFMAVVIFLYFRTVVPSSLVVLAVLADILVTISIVNLLGVKLGSAGIAAFLMLIGYSVDTDILLSTKVLKSQLTITEGINQALKTGLMMSFTTLVAVSIAMIFSSSDVIRQIMMIILIGLCVDLIFTWFFNAPALRFYLERKGKSDEQNN